MNLSREAKPLVIVGAGGHGRVVAEAASLSGQEVVGFVDKKADGLPPAIDGIPILGDDSWLANSSSMSLGFTIGLGAPRVSQARRELFDMACTLGLTPQTVIHPSSVISPKADIEAGVQILANSVIQRDSHISSNSIINSSATVEHDCHVSRDCHIAPGAILLGGVSVGASSVIGAGSVVLPGSVVAARSAVRAATVFAESS